MDSLWSTWIEDIHKAKDPIDITVYGFTRCAPNYYIAPRTLPEHLIYVVQEHSVLATFSDKQVIVEPGQIMWVPGGVEHCFQPAIPKTRVLVHHYRFFLPDGCPQTEPLISNVNTHQRERFAILHDGGSPEDPIWNIRFRTSVILTLCELGEETTQHGRQEHANLNAAQRMQIMKCINDNLWIDPEGLAMKLDYHPAYFTRIFKQSFGIAPRTWILQQRMQRAAVMLLENDAPIQNIADDIGYQDPFIFSRQFKQIHGVSPKIYRSKHNAPRELT